MEIINDSLKNVVKCKELIRSYFAEQDAYAQDYSLIEEAINLLEKTEEMLAKGS